ncbi:hypothetical protein [Microlunatus sp. Y2014]|uniref:hypothetical protein n=1 Tax=Microlunatus sp. Y2014 TaxID=3418488 RepID=UPI003DA7944F
MAETRPWTTAHWGELVSLLCEGHDAKTIAQLLGCPAGTVRSRTRRLLGDTDILGGSVIAAAWQRFDDDPDYDWRAVLAERQRPGRWPWDADHLLDQVWNKTLPVSEASRRTNTAVRTVLTRLVTCGYASSVEEASGHLDVDLSDTAAATLGRARADAVRAHIDHAVQTAAGQLVADPQQPPLDALTDALVTVDMAVERAGSLVITIDGHRLPSSAFGDTYGVSQLTQRLCTALAQRCSTTPAGEAL